MFLFSQKIWKSKFIIKVHMRRWIPILVGLLFLFSCRLLFAYQPLGVVKFDQPETNPIDVSEGHLQISWSFKIPQLSQKLPQITYQIEQAASEFFENGKVRYEGPDTSTFISGLASGTVFYRVRAMEPSGGNGPWSEALQVNVKYVSQKMVYSLMAIGFAVLIATIGVILIGHRRSEHFDSVNHKS